jgi:exopolysaccharide biosynthesis polyprenyl glycosylphosphotransferase
MEYKWHDVSLRMAKLLNAVLMTACFSVVWLVFYSKGIASPYHSKGNLMMIALFFFLYIVLGQVYDAFLISYYPLFQVVYSQGLAVLISDGFIFIVIWLLTKKFPNPFPGILTFFVQVLVSTIWTAIVQKWYFRTFSARKSIVIYDTREGLDRVIEQQDLNKKFEIIATVQIVECLRNIEMIDKANTVFLSGIHSHERNIILKRCIDKGIRVMVIPRIGDVLMSSATDMHLFYLPMLMVERFNPRLEYSIVKRLFDIVCSFLALVVLSPLMIITAIMIKATDHGPVLYKQVRLTKDGKEFEIFKFRSMRTDAEKDGVARLSTGKNDDRITPIGRVIRATRIDELPQFINVLRGEMSIVGPRPERPEIAEQYEKEMPEFRLRLQTKAGVTGYAQVYGKYNTTPYDKLQMDLMYIAHPSLFRDLSIILATIKILFLPESTEGVVEGQITAMDYSKEEESPEIKSEIVSK